MRKNGEHSYEWSYDQLHALGKCLALLLKMEKKKAEQREKEVVSFPDGRLHIRKQGGKVYFQRDLNGVRTGITRNQELVYQLARKRYVQLLQKERAEMMARCFVSLHSSGAKIRPEELARSMAAARRTRRTGAKKESPLEKLLDFYGKAGLEILRITCSKQQYAWMKANYRRNESYAEQRTFETYSGIKVRSKSEQAIGNMLEVRGIPYRYEAEISLEVSWMDGVRGGTFGGGGRQYKKYYPDFMILTATGEILIWEHLGMIHEESYRAHNMEKIAAYRQTGLCDDAHLILTYECDMVKPETLEIIFLQRVLPYF